MMRRVDSRRHSREQLGVDALANARPHQGSQDMRKVFEIGGLVAGARPDRVRRRCDRDGHERSVTVSNSLKQQQIVGTADMTPGRHQGRGAEGRAEEHQHPDLHRRQRGINSGSRARCFAEYMQIHALEATGGFLYSQMGIYIAKPGTPKAQLMPGGGTDNTRSRQSIPPRSSPCRTAPATCG